MKSLLNKERIMSLSKYKLGELIENCHTDLFVANATHGKEEKYGKD